MPVGMPSQSGAGFYNPGAIRNEYETVHNQPPLPGVQPPSGVGSAATAAADATILQSGFFDEAAPDILNIIQGGTFDPPFTITLMRREGVQIFKSDAGVKREANYKLCKETIREPGDLLRISAGIVAEIYKPLNNMSLEFQLMLYIAAQTGGLKVPQPAGYKSDKGSVVAGIAAELAEETVEP